MTRDLSSLLDTAFPPDAAQARKLIERISAIRLFAHAYAHHLNLRFGTVTPEGLLQFAQAHRLAGVKIHVEDGEAASLLQRAPAQRQAFGAAAAGLGLELHIETSSTAPADLTAAVAIAHDTGATSLRFYPRYEGRVSTILRQTISDLERLPALDPEGRLSFTLEQHEDLKSHELVSIVQAVGNPRLGLLFDFGNMVNAGERPEEALAVQAPFIREVHIKDVKILPDRGGLAHLACRSGTGEIDFHALLARLLLLGDAAPQVTAFALEEENGFYAPAYRFPDEGDDPFIPARGPSETALPEGEALEQRLARERAEAQDQVAHVRQVLDSLKAAALHLLQQPA